MSYWWHEKFNYTSTLNSLELSVIVLGLFGSISVSASIQMWCECGSGLVRCSGRLLIEGTTITTSPLLFTQSFCSIWLENCVGIELLLDEQQKNYNYLIFDKIHKNYLNVTRFFIRFPKSEKPRCIGGRACVNWCCICCSSNDRVMGELGSDDCLSTKIGLGCEWNQLITVIMSFNLWALEFTIFTFSDPLQLAPLLAILLFDELLIRIGAAPLGGLGGNGGRLECGSGQIGSDNRRFLSC